MDDGRPECVGPSIENFPADFFSQEQRRQGGVVLHFLIVIYLCGILGFVCDDYFVPSLEIIADSEYDNVYFLTVDPLGSFASFVSTW